jgi:hypothetical protein
MRKDAVEAMAKELEPRIEMARKNLAQAIELFLFSLVPAHVRTAFSLSPEFFTDMTCVRIGESRHTCWSDRYTITLKSCPVNEKVRNAFDLDRWHDEKFFSGNVLFENAFKALLGFRRALEEREDFKIEADRILSGIKCVEDIQATCPEAMRFMTIPVKPAPLVIRKDALKRLINGMKA